jgi:GTPase SAR1 family protein
MDVQQFWVGEVEKYAESNTLFVLVGNKLDLVPTPIIEVEEIKKFATLKRMLYIECSAKMNMAITDLFVEIARTLIKKESSSEMTSKPVNSEKKRKLKK